MDERKNNFIDPQGGDSYETGSTRPPKNRGGLIALLLIGVIIFGGISSVLGALNIKLFRELTAGGNPSASMSFFESTSVSTPTSPYHTGEHPSAPVGSDITVEIQDSPEGVENIPQEGGLSYQAIYAKAIPSVVSITCQTNGGASSGTGVVLSSQGYIVTNCHVVAGADSILIRLTDDRTLPACIVGLDAVSDLAVLYVEATDLTPAEFGDSAQLRVGDSVAAIGDPLGSEFRGTMTDGIVSAINRDVTVDGRTMTLIQTNAALNSGNSGGPLLNCYGQVVGINTMKISAFVDAAGVEGLGFAIPTTTVKEIVDQLLRQGYVSGRPSLGVEGESVTEFQQRYYRLPAGFLITEVADDSCAEDAGLAVGDIIYGFGDIRITSSDTLQSALYGCSVGDAVTLSIYRYQTGQQFAVTVTLDEAT